MITRMTLSGPNVLIPSRKRIAAQLVMENDEFLMRGEPSLFVKWRDSYFRLGSKDLD